MERIEPIRLSRSDEQMEQTSRSDERDGNSPNQRVHFFAEFCQYGWCRNMKVLGENAPVKYGIRLCDSKKVVEQILENECENVV